MIPSSICGLLLLGPTIRYKTETDSLHILEPLSQALQVSITWTHLALAFFRWGKKEGNELFMLTNTNFIPANGEIGYQ